MSTNPTPLDTALSLLTLGYSPVPAMVDGTKRPVGAWRPYSETAATAQTVRAWYSTSDYGVGVVTGRVSGNLVMLEVEGRAAHRINELKTAAEPHRDLWNRVNTGWIEKSPSGGYHWFIRLEQSATVPGNTKLAVGKDKQVLAETRGEGGFVVLAPTGEGQPEAHSTGRPWTREVGGPGTCPVLTLAEYETLCDIFRALDERPEPVKQSPLPAPRSTAPQGAVNDPFSVERGPSPGDDFEANVTWAEILEPHGWHLHSRHGQELFWTRPGKNPREGHSASTGRAEDRDRLWVFTSSTDFEPETPYTKFGAWAHLNHGGDMKAAAEALRGDGYGAPRPRAAHAPGSAPLSPSSEEEGPHGENLPTLSTAKLKPMTALDPTPPTSWIGRGWIPRREITVLVGEEGIGKSLLWVLIAARITTGREFKPFNIPARPPSCVAVVVTEDNASEVKARLELAGADLDKILWFAHNDDGSGAPTLGRLGTGDMEALERQLQEREDTGENVAFLVVDAWLDTVPAGYSIKDPQHARQVLHPFKELAAKFGMGVMLLTHTNRLDTAHTRDRMGGTAELRKKARMVLYAARKPLDDDARSYLWVGPEKANGTRLENAFKFQVGVKQVRPMTDDDAGTSATLINPADACMSISALVGQWHSESKRGSKEPTKAEQAAEAIREHLSPGQTIPVKELNEYLEGLGFRKSAIEEAKRLTGNSGPQGKQAAWVFTRAERDLAA